MPKDKCRANVSHAGNADKGGHLCVSSPNTKSMFHRNKSFDLRKMQRLAKIILGKQEACVLLNSTGSLLLDES